MVSIETGVDKLVRLVAKEKKIELSDAAKQLGVDTAVVQEWAEFLEEEGIAGLQYSLSKTFIVEKRLAKGDVERKDKEYENRREAFVRKVDSALKRLSDESAGFESIKKEYDSVKDHIGDRIDAVKEEIEQLRHYEELKRSIDQDVLKQRVEYQKNIDDIHTRLTAEEKRYQKIIGDIGTETTQLQQEHAEFSDIKKEEHDLLKRIDALQDIIKNISSRLESQSKSISSHEDRLTTLRTLAEKLREDLIDKRKSELEPMLKVSNDQGERIMRIQNEIVEKVKRNRNTIQDVEVQSKAIAERFQKFFERRIETEKLLKDIEKARDEVREGLTDLVRKAKAYDLAAKGADTAEHIRKLEGDFKDYDKKRTVFGQKVETLRSFILGKDEAKAAVSAQKKEDAPAKNVVVKKPTKSVPKKSRAKKKQ